MVLELQEIVAIAEDLQVAFCSRLRAVSYTHLTLAGVKFSTVFTDKELYLFSFLKLLVLPMITFFVLRFFIKDRTLLEISTILSGCPIAGNVSMLCMEYNRDVTLVSKGICISTLLSMISIPIVSALVAIL